jgi:hypothetical protein
MFFDWERAESQTGLAIHAAVRTDIAKLGGRASGGCVHLAPTMRRRFTDIDPGKLSRVRAALCLRSRNQHRQQSGRLHARPQAADCALTGRLSRAGRA